jgi:flagellar hook-length control protein FliK
MVDSVNTQLMVFDGLVDAAAGSPQNPLLTVVPGTYSDFHGILSKTMPVQPEPQFDSGLRRSTTAVQIETHTLDTEQSQPIDAVQYLTTPSVKQYDIVNKRAATDVLISEPLALPEIENKSPLEAGTSLSYGQRVATNGLAAETIDDPESAKESVAFENMEYTSAPTIVADVEQNSMSLKGAQNVSHPGGKETAQLGFNSATQAATNPIPLPVIQVAEKNTKIEELSTDQISMSAFNRGRHPATSGTGRANTSIGFTQLITQQATPANEETQYKLTGNRSYVSETTQVIDGEHTKNTFTKYFDQQLLKSVNMDGSDPQNTIRIPFVAAETNKGEVENLLQSSQPALAASHNNGLRSEQISGNTLDGKVVVTSHLQSQNWNEEVGQRVTWLARQNMQQAELQLNPKHLGAIEVRISISQDQQVNISFMAQHTSVKESIDAAIPKLKEMFLQQGMDLVNVDVSQESFKQRSQHRNPGAMPRWETDTGQSIELFKHQNDATAIGDLGTVSNDRMIDYFV